MSIPSSSWQSNRALKPQSSGKPGGCLKLALAGILGMIAGCLLTLAVEASILPGLFDRIHDFFSREAAAPAPPLPTQEMKEEAERRSRMKQEMEELARQRMEQLEKELKEHQEEGSRPSPTTKTPAR